MCIVQTTSGFYEFDFMSPKNSFVFRAKRGDKYYLICVLDVICLFRVKGEKTSFLNAIKYWGGML